jgi:hypothetical protein
MTIWERIYRVLLKAYPATFYREYGEPMMQLFRDQLREAVRTRQLLRFFGRIIADLVRTAPACYWSYSSNEVGGVMLWRRTLAVGSGLVFTCAGFWTTNQTWGRPQWLSSILMQWTLSLPFPASVIYPQILLTTLDLLVLAGAIAMFLSLTGGLSSRRFLRGSAAASIGLAIGRISSMLLGMAHLLPYAVRPGALLNTGLLSMLFGLALSIWVIRQMPRAAEV